MKNTSAAITVTDLCFAHIAEGQRTPVFEGLSFCLPAGGTLAVIGASGCGKSTLLYLLAGLTQPDSGTVRTGDGTTLPLTSFILQDYGLFPWKRVRENLMLPLRLAGWSRTQSAEVVADMVAEMGLSGLEDRYPARLSGGQRQRVAIGRALITRPGILLMDEPFSSLDALTREQLQQTVLDLWRKHRPTCVLVTHDVNEALLLGQHLLVLCADGTGGGTGGTGGTGRADADGAKRGPIRKGLWLDNPWFGLSPADAQDLPQPLPVSRMEMVRRIRAALAGIGATNTPHASDESCPGVSATNVPHAAEGIYR